MNVFVLIRKMKTTNEIVGVFSTKEKADEWKDKLTNKGYQENMFMAVPYELDSEYYAKQL